MINKIKFLSLISIVFTFFVQAQPLKFSEKEVQLQGAFIDGAMFQSLEKYEKAEQIYLDVIEKDAKNATANYELARVYGAQKKHEKALVNAKNAVNLDKTNTWYKLLYAEILGNFGKHKEAAELYEALVKIEPNNEYYYYEWAESLGASGNKEKAIKAFEQLEKKIGVDEDISRQKHILFLELGDNKKAEKELEKLVYHFPENTDFLHLLAGFYKQIGDKEKELATYKRVLNISPSDGKASLALATGNKSGNNKEADYLAALKPIFSNKEIALDVKIKELIPFATKVANTNDRNTADACLELVKILVGINPEEAKVFAIYGDFLYHSGRVAESLVQYKKTVKLNANVYTVWEQIFQIENEQKDFDALLMSTNTALELFPNQANVFYFNGLANLEKQKTSDAVNSLEQAAIMVGKNNRLKLEVFFLLGKANYSLKKYDITKENLTKTLSIGGENNAAILDLLGNAYFQTNDVENAVAAWQKAKIKGSKSPVLDKKIADRKIYE
jgi:tetratricopeptide (TPR) repeat protein